MEQVRKALFPALAVLLCGCVRTLGTEGALTVVPYELTDSGRILVDVLIDGRGPFTFALDTAASISLIFEDPGGELVLEPVPTTSAIVRGLVASGRYPVVRAGRLQVGSEVWPNPKMVAVPGNTVVARSVTGILGIDFLRRYGLWFSAQDRALRFYSPDSVSDRSYRGWAAVPLEPVNIGAASEPLYFFDIDIGGRTMPALFDLGAGANLINAPAAQFLRLAPVDSANELELAGALDTVPILARLQSEMTTANVRWRNVDLLIADIEIFATLLHEDRPLAILGSGLFNQRDFVIDFVRNRLLVSTEMDERERVR